MSIRVYVFNDYTNSFESYYLGLKDTLRYVTNDTLKAKEFGGSSSSTVLWTH